MKKIILLLLFLFIKGFSQGVLPVSRYTIGAQPLLNESPTTSTFAYSLRKLKTSYSGYALRVRNINNNSTADIFFDTSDIVSNKSSAVIVVKGSSIYNVGQNIPLSTFKGTEDLAVEIWYNQETTGYNAVQNAAANQPLLDLAGGPASLPTLLFFGNNAYDSKYLVVQANINSICPGGLGSFLMVTKPTANIQQGSFGAIDYENWRWSFHLNWDDGNLYFDAAEYCCQNYRNIYNNDMLNLWKQYSFVRGSFTKNIRTNAIERIGSTGAVGASPSYVNPYGFGIGISTNFDDPGNTTGYQGSISEVLMFQRALNTQEIVKLENNQMNYWKIR